VPDDRFIQIFSHSALFVEHI